MVVQCAGAGGSFFCSVMYSYTCTYTKQLQRLKLERAADKDSIAKLAVHLNNLFLFTLFHLFAYLVAITRGEHLHFSFFSAILAERI